MPSLALYLLGPPRIERDGRAVEFDTRKATALLAYLAVTGHAHRRDSLAALLWPESGAAQARGALRRTLAAIRQSAGPEWLDTDQETVGLRQETPGCWTDVAELGRMTGACRQHGHPGNEPCAAGAGSLAEAVELYRGDLLAGFSLKDSPGFDHWLLGEADRLRAEALAAHERLVCHHTEHGPWDKAVAYARRWVALDASSETAHCHLMRLLAWTGRRSAALRQYRECLRLLDEELGAPPLPATVALYEEIRSGRLPTPTVPGPGLQDPGLLAGSPAGDSGTVESRAHDPLMPSEEDGFVGRAAELRSLGELLTATRACRLLTLLGPGGIGKTRLAAKAAESARTAFADGVVAVPLAAVAGPELLVPAIANALGLAIPGDRDPRAELLAVLCELRLLLVLDNFEHLLGGIDLLGEILRQAPSVKLLVTSRERLAIEPEWSFEVEGLDFPETEEAGDPTAYGAVRLFLAHARKVRPDVASSPEDLQEVLRLCRLTRGMPLALELAAPWVRVLPLADIGSEIAAGLDLLATTRRDAPERHRSMRAVFEESWLHLDDDERRAFRQASVFRGGFGRAAAEEVAGAALPLLAALADKSFVKPAAGGRYEVHELLRQCGAEKLAGLPEEAERAAERHADHYTAWLAERATALRGDRQRQALEEIAGELENVRAAWRFAAARGRHDELLRAAEALFDFYELRGWFQEGASAFDAACKGLGERIAPEDEQRTARCALARCTVGRASFAFRLGDYEGARTLFREARATAAAIASTPDHGFALIGVGLSSKVLGDYGTALRCFEEAVDLLSSTRHRWARALALHSLGEMAYGSGQYLEALPLLEESLDLFRELGDRRMIARMLLGLARIAFLSGRHQEARRLFEEGLATSRQVEDQWGIALSLQRLGAMAEKAGELDEAASYLGESLRLCRKIGDRRGALVSLIGLGQVSARRGAESEAWEHLQAALAVASDLKTTPHVLAALVAAVPLVAKGGATATAREILAAAAAHPAATRESRETAARLATELDLAPLPASTRSLEELVAEVGECRYSIPGR